MFVQLLLDAHVGAVSLHVPLSDENAHIVGCPIAHVLGDEVLSIAHLFCHLDDLIAYFLTHSFLSTECLGNGDGAD
ncbi:hypothetical protein SDC9_194630 [bioreactor metagenome]|uniref:Uncharacterized protein n=1 Tax=bioreactor metagenome TaxID=1076179 RepID=A0A645I7E2_9ZZZZ